MFVGFSLLIFSVIWQLVKRISLGYSCLLRKSCHWLVYLSRLVPKLSASPPRYPLNLKQRFFSFLFFSSRTLRLVGVLVPDQGWNSCPLQWKHGVLTTGPPGSSPKVLFFWVTHLICPDNFVLFQNFLLLLFFIVFLVIKGYSWSREPLYIFRVLIREGRNSCIHLKY